MMSRLNRDLTMAETPRVPGGARVSFAEIVTDKGHDAFLLEEPELFAIVRGFLDGAGRVRGLAPGGR